MNSKLDISNLIFIVGNEALGNDVHVIIFSLLEEFKELMKCAHHGKSHHNLELAQYYAFSQHTMRNEGLLQCDNCEVVLKYIETTVCLPGVGKEWNCSVDRGLIHFYIRQKVNTNFTYTKIHVVKLHFGVVKLPFGVDVHQFVGKYYFNTSELNKLEDNSNVALNRSQTDALLAFATKLDVSSPEKIRKSLDIVNPLIDEAKNGTSIAQFNKMKDANIVSLIPSQFTVNIAQIIANYLTLDKNQDNQDIAVLVPGNGPLSIEENLDKLNLEIDAIVMIVPKNTPLLVEASDYIIVEVAPRLNVLVPKEFSNEVPRPSRPNGNYSKPSSNALARFSVKLNKSNQRGVSRNTLSPRTTRRSSEPTVRSKSSESHGGSKEEFLHRLESVSDKLDEILKNDHDLSRELFDLVAGLKEKINVTVNDKSNLERHSSELQSRIKDVWGRLKNNSYAGTPRLTDLKKNAVNELGDIDRRMTAWHRNLQKRVTSYAERDSLGELRNSIRETSDKLKSISYKISSENDQLDKVLQLANNLKASITTENVKPIIDNLQKNIRSFQRAPGEENKRKVKEVLQRLAEAKQDTPLYIHHEIDNLQRVANTALNKYANTLNKYANTISELENEQLKDASRIINKLSNQIRETTLVDRIRSKIDEYKKLPSKTNKAELNRLVNELKVNYTGSRVEQQINSLKRVIQKATSGETSDLITATPTKSATHTIFSPQSSEAKTEKPLYSTASQKSLYTTGTTPRSVNYTTTPSSQRK